METQGSSGAPRRGWDSRRKKRHTIGPLPPPPRHREPEASAAVTEG